VKVLLLRLKGTFVLPDTLCCILHSRLVHIAVVLVVSDILVYILFNLEQVLQEVLLCELGLAPLDHLR